MCLLVNCDWLQYSVLTAEPEPELYCPEGWRVEVMTGNNIFQHRAFVLDGRGRKWLTLLWCPYSSVLNARLMTVQLGNFVLYGSGILAADRLLHQVVDCAFNSMGRIDLCADFQVDEGKLEVIKHLNSGHYYIQGKSEGSAWWHDMPVAIGDRSIRRKQTHCLSWGSKTSKIKVKLYNKSREQGMLGPEPEPEKPYIVQQWREAGWDVKRVWRLEFSMCSTGQLAWNHKAIMLEDVASGDWVSSVFSALLRSRFVVRINEGRRVGHKNLDPIVPFISWDASAVSLRWVLGRGDGIEVGEEVKALRSLVSQLHSPVVSASRDMSAALCSAIDSLVRSAHMEGYFCNKFGCHSWEYLDDVMEKAGSCIVEVDANPRRLFD